MELSDHPLGDRIQIPARFNKSSNTGWFKCLILATVSGGPRWGSDGWLMIAVGHQGYREAAHRMAEFKFFFRILQQVSECFMAQVYIGCLVEDWNYWTYSCTVEKLGQGTLLRHMEWSDRPSGDRTRIPLLPSLASLQRLVGSSMRRCKTKEGSLLRERKSDNKFEAIYQL
ncbi:hypothetical protein AKJ16_DCAP07211 [Drosera capensis]